MMVKDIAAGSTSTSNSNLIDFGGVACFFANDSVHGMELWRSDGTEAGTYMVKDVNPNGSFGSNPNYLTSVGGLMYFAAYSAGTDVELWRSDGTETGTFQVTDIAAGDDGSYPNALQVVDQTLFFEAQDALGVRSLWRIENAGTTPGEPYRIESLAQRGVDSSPSRAVELNGIAYFPVDDGVHGRELWRSDGTLAGTYLVVDLTPGASSSFSYFQQFADDDELVVADNRLFFWTGPGMRGLWTSDGTETGTLKIERPDELQWSIVRGLTPVGDDVVFVGHDSFGYAIWQTDGTEGGTVRLTEYYDDDVFSQLTDVDGTLYFTIPQSELSMSQLWKSDGTPTGTEVVKTFQVADGEGLGPQELTNYQGTLYFTAFEPSSGRELWTSDGTEAGTLLVHDI